MLRYFPQSLSSSSFLMSFLLFPVRNNQATSCSRPHSIQREPHLAKEHRQLRRKVGQSVPWLLPNEVENSPIPGLKGHGGRVRGRLAFILEVTMCHRRFCTLAVFFIKSLSGVADHLLHTVTGSFQTLSNPPFTETPPGRTTEETQGKVSSLPQVTQLLRVYLRFKFGFA